MCYKNNLVLRMLFTSLTDNWVHFTHLSVPLPFLRRAETIHQVNCDDLII